MRDGEALAKPTALEVAQRAGLRTEPGGSFYDLVIVGAGPAGLASAVYGASEGLSVVLLDGRGPRRSGGHLVTHRELSGLSRGAFRRRLNETRGHAGAALSARKIIAPREVARVTTDGPYKIVSLKDGDALRCHALVIATGVSYRKLDIPGLESLTGAGVYYGSSMAEAAACRDEDVFIVGAGNSAGQAAMYLSGHARSVTMLVRGTSLGAKMSQYLVDQIEAVPNISVRLETEVTEVFGNGRLEALTLTRRGGDRDEHERVGREFFVHLHRRVAADGLVGGDHRA